MILKIIHNFLFKVYIIISNKTLLTVVRLGQTIPFSKGHKPKRHRVSLIKLLGAYLGA